MIILVIPTGILLFRFYSTPFNTLRAADSTGACHCMQRACHKKREYKMHQECSTGGHAES